MTGIFDCRHQHLAAASAAVASAIGGSLGDKNLATWQLPESASLLDNIYVKFGSKIFKQKKGILIGLDSGQDIANLLLYYYESNYVKELSRDDISNNS